MLNHINNNYFMMKLWYFNVFQNVSEAKNVIDVLLSIALNFM